MKPTTKEINNYLPLFYINPGTKKCDLLPGSGGYNIHKECLQQLSPQAGLTETFGGGYKRFKIVWSDKYCIQVELEEKASDI